MGRLIDEDIVIGALMEQFKRNTPIAIRAKLTVEALPSAQPEREKGKWILGGYEDMYYICDQCGHKETEYYSVPKANFCKVCGADMRGEQDEDK